MAKFYKIMTLELSKPEANRHRSHLQQGQRYLLSLLIKFDALLSGSDNLVLASQLWGRSTKKELMVMVLVLLEEAPSMGGKDQLEPNQPLQERRRQWASKKIQFLVQEHPVPSIRLLFWLRNEMIGFELNCAFLG